MVKRVSSQSWSSSSCMRWRVSASRAAKGSSMRRMSGSITSARAMATLCFIPPESVWGKLSANLVRLTLAIAAMKPVAGVGAP